MQSNLGDIGIAISIYGADHLEGLFQSKWVYDCIFLIQSDLWKENTTYWVCLKSVQIKLVFIVDYQGPDWKIRHFTGLVQYLLKDYSI